MYRFFIFLLLIFLPFINSAQNIKGGLIAGFNITQVDGDEEYGYHKVGLNVGALAIVPFGKKFSASLETIYNQKGSYQSPLFADSLSGEYKLILNYLEVPVLFNYTDKDVIKFGVGFSWGRLVQFKEWQHGNRINWTTPYGPYKVSDTDVLLDVQFKLFTGLYFDLRYAYSVAKIRTREFEIKALNQKWTRKQFNNDATFRLVYVFKDAPSVKAKKKIEEVK
jgi:hypothetical protein